MNRNSIYTDSYRTAVSLLQRKASGTNAYRRYLKTFRRAYVTARDDETRDDVATERVAELAREVRR
jgi:hypothetical protein